MSKFVKLLPSALVLAAVASLSSSCAVGPDNGGAAMVMFKWEANYEQIYIREIMASFEDVRYWRDNVYMSGGYFDEDATADPLYNGIYDLHERIYSSNSPQLGRKYNGVCLPISKGAYTAVCTINDPIRDNTVHIVANYSINLSASDTSKYFEVAFEVKKFLDGKNDTAWVFRKYDSNPCPNL